MAWRFELAAPNPSDLATLASAFPAGRASVEHHDGRYEMVARSLDGVQDPVTALEEARRLIRWMTGYTRTVDSHFGACRLTGKAVDPSGRRHTVVEVGGAGIRARAGGISVGPAELLQPPPGLSVIAVAATDTAVSELLELMAGPLDWIELYKVLEIVKQELGVDGVVARGWASKADLERFSRTANHPEASGPTGRHARVSVDVPPRPMSLDEARAMLSRAVKFFVQERGALHDRGPTG